MAASRDIYTALLYLTGFAKTHGLRDEAVEIGRIGDDIVETMTVGQLLQIASDAYNQSVNEVVFVYRQLLENAEAAASLVEAMPTEFSTQYADYLYALSRTLDQRPIAKRGLVNEAKREIARMVKEGGGIRGGRI